VFKLVMTWSEVRNATTAALRYVECFVNYWPTRFKPTITSTKEGRVYHSAKLSVVLSLDLYPTLYTVICKKASHCLLLDAEWKHVRPRVVVYSTRPT
jgi:hypothetical protein